MYQGIMVDYFIERAVLLVLSFVSAYWFSLRNEISSIFTIVISPSVHFRNFSRPVAMARTDRRCPFKRCCPPWILRTDPPAFENGIEEVEYEKQLDGKNDH